MWQEVGIMRINSHFYFRRCDILNMEADNKDGDEYDQPWNEHDSEIVSICTHLGSIKYAVGDLLSFSNFKDCFNEFIVKRVEYMVSQVELDEEDFDEVQTVYVVPNQSRITEEIDKFK